MSEKLEHTILLVDDEESILNSLKRLLKPLRNKILTSTDGKKALEVIKENDISVIISDQRMPGMSGIEMLQKSMELSPESIRILLTGYADINTTIDAINSGAVKYYFNKPWEDELIISRIKESLDLYATTIENKQLHKLTAQQNKKLKEFNENLQQKVDEQTAEIKEQHRELNESFMETIKAFSTFIEMRHKEVGSHSQRVALMVKNMLKGFDLQPGQFQDIVVAAYLHDIGKISLPDRILKKKPEEYSFSEKELVKKHPTIGQTCVFNISGFGKIGVIIRNHHENYDGSGYPDGEVERQISLGSRIIRLCNDFDHYAFRASYPDLKTLNEATARLVQFSSTKYDPELAKKFIDMDIAKSLYHEETGGTSILKPGDLQEGMIVADDVYTQNGLFLLPKGAKLSKGMINRIRKINDVDPVSGDIKVYKEIISEKEENVPV